MISGFGTAMIWTTQGEYITLCNTENSVGFYFSLFWVIFMSSQVLGNLIGSIIVTRTSGPIFFLIMGLIVLAGNMMFLFIR
jgi:hypothetical protein